MYVCTYACILYVYSMYVCVYVGTEMSDIDNMPTNICSSMHIHTATMKNTTLRYILLHSWSKYFSCCVTQIFDCGDAHMYRIFVICTCFQTCGQSREEHFMVVVPSALAPTCTHTALLGTGALHDLTTYSCDIDYHCPEVRQRRASRTGSEQQRFTHMFL